MNDLVASQLDSARDSNRRRHPTLIRVVVYALLVFAAYYIGSKIGFALTFHPYPVSTLWPPNAILLATLLLAPVRLWWVFLLAVFPAHLIIQLNLGVPLPMVLGWFVSNTSEALIGALLIRRILDEPLRLDSFRQASIFLLCGVFIAVVTTSFMDAAFVSLNGWGEVPFWGVWRGRSLSNILAILTLVPVIVLAASSGIAQIRRFIIEHYVEISLFALGLVSIGVMVFGGQGEKFAGAAAFVYAPLAFLIWAALRFGPGVLSISLLITSVMAIWGAIHSRGPFTFQTPSENVLSLQIFLILLAMPLMLLAAILQERKKTDQALRESEERLARTEAFSLVMVTYAGLDGRWLKVPPTLCKLLGYTEQELLSGYFKDVTHPDDFEADWSQCQRLIRGEIKSFDLEKRYIHKDGHIIWVYLNCSIVTDSTGTPLHFLTYIRDITKRKQMEQALQESEERYRAIVEEQTDLVCRYLPDTTLTFVNEAYCRYFGKTREELIGTSFLKLVPEERREVARSHISDLYENPRIEHYEHSVIKPNNETRWQSWVDYAIFDENRAIQEFQAVGRDITERKRAEDALRESEERFRIMADTAPVMIWISDANSRSYFYNKPWLNFTGRTLEQEINNGWREGVHPDDLQRYHDTYLTSFEARRPFTIEYRLRRADGEYRCILDTGVPRFTARGEFAGYIGSSIDITERRLAEQRLKESERKLRLLTELIPQQVWSALPDGSIDYVNQRWIDFTGMKLEEALGEGGLKTLHPNEHKMFPTDQSENLAKGIPFEREIRLRGADGEYRWFLARWLPLLNEEGQIIRWYGTNTDIEDRKRGEEALLKSEEALRESHARIEELAGKLIIAQDEERKRIKRELHEDLNQQVASLALGLGKLERQLAQANNSIRDQITKLEGRTTTLSERMSQMSHELHSSTLEHVGLPAALKYYCSEFSEREGISVSIYIQDEMESISQDAALCLYRVAQESLQNIAQHSGAKTAQVTLTGDSEAIELSVTDQGVGFDPKQVKLGRGLGLISIEQRVKMLHGNLQVKAHPGAGTELKAHLPRRSER